MISVSNDTDDREQASKSQKIEDRKTKHEMRVLLIFEISCHRIWLG